MNIHFISIGGSVMHQLAIALKRKGYKITGSDDEIFEPAKTNLEKENLLPEQEGWFPEKINKSLEAVILGMHAKQDNPELLKARDLNLPVYSFPEYIFKESRDKIRIVIGGSHGKTTTTAMIMHVLKKTKYDFDYLVGARLQDFDQSVNITHAPILICEGDEYPASAIERKPKFHFLFPHIAVITGIAWDHINVFPTFEIYLEQFRIFIEKIEPGGHLIYNEADEVLNKLVKDKLRDDITYIPYHIPEHTITDGTTEVVIEEEKASLKVFGNHNLLNLNAAWHVCKQIRVSSKKFVENISDFKGAAKRLELLAQNQQTVVYRDFAHAPSKVKATIDAVKEQFPSKELIAVLELHTYSSLNEKFTKEYEGVMKKADVPAVFFSKQALKIKRLPELNKETVKAGFNEPTLKVFDEREQLELWLKQNNYANSVVLLMSSGNYEGIDVDDLAKTITLKAM